MKHLLIALGLCVGFAHAQAPETPIEPEVELTEARTDGANEVIETEVPELVVNPLQPDINVRGAVPVGETITLDAADSKLGSPSEGQATYSWDAGDGTPLLWGVQVKHTYENVGQYDIKLNIKQGSLRESSTKSIIAYDRRGVLVTDTPRPDVVAQAAASGLWLSEIPYETGDTQLATEEAFVAALSQKIPQLQQSDIILFWSQSTDPLQTFAQWSRELTGESALNLSSTMVAQITEGPLQNAEQQVRTAVLTMGNSGTLLTRPEGATQLWSNTNAASAGSALLSRGVEWSFVDERTGGSGWRLLSRAMSYFAQNGVSQSVIYLLLAVPFLAFFVAFFRQFVGIKTYGVYTPMMLGLSLLVLGLQVGLLAFVLVLLVSTLIRWVFARIEMLYIPKVALTLSVLALSFFVVLWAGVELNIDINWGLAVFPMLVIVTVSEKFLSNQSSAGLRNALIYTLETLLVAFVGWAFLQWDFIEQLIMRTPEVVFIPLLGSYWLGKFSGLRLSEYFKFRAFFQESSEE